MTSQLSSRREAESPGPSVVTAQHGTPCRSGKPCARICLLILFPSPQQELLFNVVDGKTLFTRLSELLREGTAALPSLPQRLGDLREVLDASMQPLDRVGLEKRALAMLAQSLFHACGCGGPLDSGCVYEVFLAFAVANSAGGFGAEKQQHAIATLFAMLRIAAAASEAAVVTGAPRASAVQLQPAPGAGEGGGPDFLLVAQLAVGLAISRSAAHEAEATGLLRSAAEGGAFRCLLDALRSAALRDDERERRMQYVAVAHTTVWTFVDCRRGRNVMQLMRTNKHPGFGQALLLLAEIYEIVRRISRLFGHILFLF